MEAQPVQSSGKQAGREYQRFSQRMVNLLGGDNGRIPLDGEWKSITRELDGKVSFGIVDDGFDVGVTNDGEMIHFARKTFHAFVRWYLLQYAKEWFGLRRKLYYHFLKKECDYNNKMGAEFRNREVR